ncbi:hypothetical protein BDN71DRAFT_1507902 [Pleurotus eryngii]|uniref:F-box domain-containing protein n=1 Tax=Pleurotus eryngii TaxID=5323 RepID=A0A9P6DF79_PLEER|nr:hypothetical protein BDN71DRAFT_1507902 [Pleurotus eryngii]
MDSLPPELFYAIFREIDDKDTLYTLLFVSRVIHGICEPLFYKSIRLTGDASGNRLNACLDRLLADGNGLVGCIEEFTLGFLVAQPTLEHLELRFDLRVSVTVNLPDDSLPHLFYLHAPLLLAAAITPDGTAKALQQVISLFVADVLMSRPTFLYSQQCKNLKYIRLPGDGPYPTSRILNVLAIGGIEVRYAQITGSLERLDVIVDAQLATEGRLMADSFDRFQRDRVATTVDINPSIWAPQDESLGLEDVDIDDA